jgi:lycopene cyclase domain-containing protein
VSYTAAALLGVVVTVVLDLFVLRTRLLLRRAFWVSYAIVVFFQLITNGILTGRGIVFYDGDVIVGSTSSAGQTPTLLGDGRVVFAPLEDLMFGFALVVQTLAWWVWWGRRVDR